MKFANHIIPDRATIREALNLINDIALRANVLFVIDPDGRLRGSLTDGDIRRALLNTVGIDSSVTVAMNSSCRYLVEGKFTNHDLRELRRADVEFLPVVNSDGRLVDVLDLDAVEYILPTETVLMAGGSGTRMHPLTLDLPKPLLPVGDKPIIEHNIDRLIRFGVRRIHVCVHYLADKIKDHLKDGSAKGIAINYLCENAPLGTIGALSLLDEIQHDSVLLMNSDLLTNIDFGNFYDEFVRSDADMAVASVPYHVDLPYAVMKLDDASIISLEEKPRYTYFANAGIYLMKREMVASIPKGSHYNSTDLIEQAIRQGKRVINFPILGYWLDVGRLQDYAKAQEDIKFLEL